MFPFNVCLRHMFTLNMFYKYNFGKYDNELFYQMTTLLKCLCYTNLNTFYNYELYITLQQLCFINEIKYKVQNTIFHKCSIVRFFKYPYNLINIINTDLPSFTNQQHVWSKTKQ